MNRMSRRASILASCLILTACTAAAQPQPPQSDTTPDATIATTPALVNRPVGQVAATSGCSVPAIPAEGIASTGGGTTFGSANYPPILSIGQLLPAVKAPATSKIQPRVPPTPPNGLPLQVAMLDPAVASDSDAAGDVAGHGASVRIYYAKSAIEADTTILDLYRGGGAFLSEAETSGQDAALVKSVIGEAATIIQVGKFDAALVHADPLANGVRTWNLYWSDGVRDYSLIVGGEATDAIQSAQSMFC